MERFDIVDDDAIQSGWATDAYFLRTEEALQQADKNPHVVAEVTADQFGDGEFEVFAGLKDAAVMLADLDADIDVDALPEGTLFDGGPVMRIEGNYLDFARWETSLLGFLKPASGIATNALQSRLAAPDSSVLSFGARHTHPAMTACVERSALIGGVDGFSHVAAGEILGREASGTMPHALMLSFGLGNQEQAWGAFNDGVGEAVPRIALCDTETDERHEVLRAVELFGDDLDGVRLDTTGSRRGNFKHIIKEVKWALDEVGRSDVDVYVSGGLGPSDLCELRDVADGFGVGGYISTADPVDFSLDIVKLDGEPISKRGKLSGRKEVYRDDGDHLIVPEHKVDSEGSGKHELLQPVIEDGELVRDFDIDAAAERAHADAERLGLDYTLESDD